MKKLFGMLLVAVCTLGLAGYAFGLNPDPWYLEIGGITASQEAVIVHGGTYSCNLTWTNPTTCYLTQNVPVVGGQTYEFGFWAYDNDTGGRLRAYVRWYDAGGTNVGSLSNSQYTTDQTVWQWISTGSGAAPATAVTAHCEIRCYDVTGWPGTATNYADDALIDDGTKVNLLSNAGFETWVGVPAVSIHDIQYNETNQGSSPDCFPSPYDGQVVKTHGIVTAVKTGTYKDFWIQDGEGPWNGVFVYDNTVQPAMGDEVELTVLVDEYNGLTELKSVSAFEILSSGNPLPDPVVINTSDIGWESGCFVGGEAYEGVLVKVEDPWCTQDLNSYNEWYICDNTAEAQVDDDIYTYDPWTGEHFEYIIGVVDYSYNIFELIPRVASDLGPALAVELASFEAVAGDGQVTLSWRTAAEINTHSFNIRRDDQIIATVDAFGDAHDYVYVDRQVANGTTYSYQISDVDLNGQETVHPMVCSVTPNAVPTDYALDQNYPNPFNPSTEIRYSVPIQAHVTLKVYNLLGQEITTLVDETKASGRHAISWDATGNASGVYFYRLQTENFSATKKMVFMK